MREHDDEHLARNATDAATLNRRIEDMEARLAVERAQIAAHARAFGHGVRRRLTSPTSLLFSMSVGFVSAEVIHERSVVKREAARRGATKPQQKAAARSVIESISKPAMSLFHIVSAGMLAKKTHDAAEV